MKFSIIIPAYNAEKHIERCVRSVMEQTYRDWECVVVDDGSADRTAELCDDLAKQDSRITVLHTPNQGVILARKNGCALCKGEYFLCVDSDDTIQSGLLETLDRILRENADADMVCFGYIRQDAAGETEVMDRFEEGMYRGKQVEIIRANFLYDSRAGKENDGAMAYSMWNKAVRKDVFIRCIERVPGGIRLGEDMLFVLNALNACRGIYISKCCGYLYSDNPDSATHRYKDGDIRNGFLLLRELLVLADGNGNRIVQAVHFAVAYLWDKYVSCGRAAENYKAFRAVTDRETDRNLLETMRTAAMPGMSRTFRIKRRLVSGYFMRTVYLYCALRFRK
jgi:glycosyltransferase involved in cell wall biosynthesis